jgi:hypothetical protein
MNRDTHSRAKPTTTTAVGSWIGFLPTPPQAGTFELDAECSRPRPNAPRCLCCVDFDLGRVDFPRVEGAFGSQARSHASKGPLFGGVHRGETLGNYCIEMVGALRASPPPPDVRVEAFALI